MHSGEGTDQWAVDGIYIGRYERMQLLEDNFNVSFLSFYILLAIS